MLINQRVIWDNNGTLTDLSINLNNLPSGTETIPIVSAEDKIYIGSDLPFNHRYLNVSTANDQASVASVEIWDGNSWNSAVDVQDRTSVAGATLAQSGILSWSKDRNKSWGQESTTEDIPALTSLKIYNLYWLRISFSADLAASTALKYVGHKFSDDEDLEVLYSQLNSSTVKTAFKAGKTDWVEQQVKSAEDIVRFLRKGNEAWSPDQIFNWEMFSDASVHRNAFWIMFGFGDDYENERKDAITEYHKALNMQNFQIDKNEDGQVDANEKIIETSWVRR